MGQSPLGSLLLGRSCNGLPYPGEAGYGSHQAVTAATLAVSGYLGPSPAHWQPAVLTAARGCGPGSCGGGAGPIIRLGGRYHDEPNLTCQ